MLQCIISNVTVYHLKCYSVIYQMLQCNSCQHAITSQMCGILNLLPWHLVRSHQLHHLQLAHWYTLLITKTITSMMMMMVACCSSIPDICHRRCLCKFFLFIVVFYPDWTRKIGTLTLKLKMSEMLSKFTLAILWQNPFVLIYAFFSVYIFSKNLACVKIMTNIRYVFYTLCSSCLSGN